MNRTIKWYIGCSGFHYNDWAGNFYPENLPKNKWFEFYTQHFNTLELNVTFYRFPVPSMLTGWYKRSPEDFNFSVKVPRLITHYKKFTGTRNMLNDFYQTVGSSLKEKTGCILFQLPPTTVYKEDVLDKILEELDLSFYNVIEFRHESWWNEPVIDLLTLHNVSFCSTSYPRLPDSMMINTPCIYCRFHGVPKLYYSAYSDKKLGSVVTEIKSDEISERAFIYFDNTAEGHAIQNARMIQQVLRKEK